jgi:hypothetical protein
MNELDGNIVGWIIHVESSINCPHATATELLLNAIALADPLASESVRQSAHTTSNDPPDA